MAPSFLRLLLLSAIPYGIASQTHQNHTVHLEGPEQVRYVGTSANQVESFLNIRFGQDTSGANRFTPPKPFHYPPGTLVNATQPGAACPQQKDAVPAIPIFDNVTHMSEDCLTLRVDRPANTSSSDKLPVMVWIYGGGDTFGQIYDSAYNATPLVAGATQKGMPVIYVAMNYRLGIFGFASSPAVNATGGLNAGLQDQRLALQWVQKHISAFGGDPDNVTLFGESDGATGAGLQMLAYGGKGKAPFKRVILESGSPAADSGMSNNKSAVHTAEVTDLVNCTASTSAEELKCLRNVPMWKLKTVAEKFEEATAGPGGMNVFAPVSPSAFLPDSPSSLLTSGRFVRNIDVMTGWNENDATMSITPAPSSEQGAAKWFAAQYPAFSKKNVAKALELYPVSQFSGMPSENITAQFFRVSQMKRDAEFTCPSIYLTQMNHKYSNSSTANYLFALNQTIFTPAFKMAGYAHYRISHMSDIPYVFNEVATKFPTLATPSHIKLASEMSGSWVSFAYHGTPSQKKGTISGWSDAMASSSTSNGTYSVQVIGGSQPGKRTVDHSRDAFEDLATRCAFWTSPDVFAQMAV